MGILEYAHVHWQDNVIASGISFVIGYIAGIRRHLKKIHAHLGEQDEKIHAIHKKVVE